MPRDPAETLSATAPYTMAILIIGLALAGYFIADYFNLSGGWTAFAVLTGVILGFALSVYDLIIGQRLAEAKQVKELNAKAKTEVLKELLEEEEKAE